MPQQTLRRGSAVIFEGLDKAGKSTQFDRLQEVLDPTSVTFVHMPSGFTEFTRGVYELLESADKRPNSGLSQQLAHLACHAESMSRLKDATESKGLVLDRWWWSTLAYGWFGGSVEQSGFSFASFKELIDTIWWPIEASLVFVFMEPHQLDSNNNRRVEDGYSALTRENSDVSILVPVDSAECTHAFIMKTLRERGLLEG